MSVFAVRLACLVIGYCFGLFQTAYIYGKTQGIDIRTKGSGNAGTTNALRVLGKKAGAIVLIGDVLKCVLAFLVASFLFSGSGIPGKLLGLYAGVGAVLGHCFPCYMQFRGGKGIACLAGLLAVFDIRVFLVCMAVFFLILATTHYVSLSSLLGVLSFLIVTVIMGQTGKLGVPPEYLREIYIVIAFVVALAWYQHRGNIGRLLSGTERKTYIFKKNKV